MRRRRPALPPRRPPIFAPVTPAERRRVERLTAGLSTLAEVVEKLGPPDARARTGRHTELIYWRLSRAAVVTVSGLDREGVLCSIVPRPSGTPRTP